MIDVEFVCDGTVVWKGLLPQVPQLEERVVVGQGRYTVARVIWLLRTSPPSVETESSAEALVHLRPGFTA